MKLEGRIIVAQPIQSGVSKNGNNWQRQDFVLEIPGQYPKKVAFSVMNSNIQRLIRLLQQILEFRKAETGNLKLRVSPGDLAAFVRTGTESFKPLVKKRKIHFSLLCDPESIVGYFDIDKLDKIMYNLLSNAAKYNKIGRAHV